MTRPRIAVIGGGVTGLAAAYELRNDAEVTLFEASDRLGGKVFTDELDGIQIEWGPDSLLARDRGPLRLLTELGLEDDIVEPDDFGAWILSGQGLRRLPGGSVLGVPTSPIALTLSGLLSPAGVLRAAADLVMPRTPVIEDTSVGSFIRKRFGDQVADRIVAPLMSGIRAGDIDDMSLEMAAPQIAEIARRSRSITLGLRRAARRATPPRFVGLRNGMSTLVSRLAEHSGAEIRLGVSVDATDRELSIGTDPFEGMIIAIPSYAAARIVGDWLDQVSWESSAVTNLVFPPASVPLLPSGTGFLVPPRSGMALTACTWVSKKWPHMSPADGRIVLRCVHSPDADVASVLAELAGAVDVTAEPTAVRTHVWEHAFPAFRVGHRGVMTAVQQTFGVSQPPLRVVGAGYLATGINDCLAHGRAAAREVLAMARA